MVTCLLAGSTLTRIIDCVLYWSAANLESSSDPSRSTVNGVVGPAIGLRIAPPEFTTGVDEDCSTGRKYAVRPMSPAARNPAMMREVRGRGRAGRSPPRSRVRSGANSPMADLPVSAQHEFNAWAARTPLTPHPVTSKANAFSNRVDVASRPVRAPSCIQPEIAAPQAPSKRRFKSLPGVFVMLGAALLLGSEAPSTPTPPAPLVGFSYSPVFSQWIESNPNSDLRELLTATNPDLVRLPIYLDDVEPTPVYLDFSSVDQLLGVVAEHNLTASRPTRVILTIGARNFMYPELHMPDWAGPRAQPWIGIVQASDAYRQYFDSSLQRYRSSPLLYAWQVENEAFDYVVNPSTGDDQISPAQMDWEVGEAH